MESTIAALLLAYRLERERERRLEAQREELACAVWRERVGVVLDRRRELDAALLFLRNESERRRAELAACRCPRHATFKGRPPSKRRELSVARAERVWDRKAIAAKVAAALEHQARVNAVAQERLCSWKTRVRIVMDFQTRLCLRCRPSPRLWIRCQRSRMLRRRRCGGW